MSTEHIPLNSLQTAVYTALSGDATLAALGASVRDWRVVDLDYPSVTLGPYTQESDRTKGYPVCVVTMEVDCWSKYEGFKEVNQIMEAVVAALTGSALTLTGGYETTNSQLVQALGLVEIDPQGNVTRHGVVQIRWFVIKTS